MVVAVIAGGCGRIHFAPVPATGGDGASSGDSNANGDGSGAAPPFDAAASSEVFVSDYNNSSIEVFAPTAVGNVMPMRTIAGTTTQLANQEALFVDRAHGELFVADPPGPAVLVFALTASGNVAPLRVLSSFTVGTAPRGLVVDEVHDELIVAGNNGSLTTFARSASGNATPLRVISGSATGLGTGFSIALDPIADELYATGFHGSVPGVVVFDRTAIGNVAPKRTITASSTNPGSSLDFIALDLAHRELVMQSDGETGFAVVDMVANGDVAPKRHVTNVTPAANGYAGLLVDIVDDRIDIAGGFYMNEILVYARTADGAAAPLGSITGTKTGFSVPEHLSTDGDGGFRGP
jgi:hypothetical protein